LEIRRGASTAASAGRLIAEQPTIRASISVMASGDSIWFRSGTLMANAVSQGDGIVRIPELPLTRLRPIGIAHACQ
jgi:hypothetical protein